MKSVLEIWIYVVRICNNGTGTDISFKMKNTYEISVADIDLCGTDPHNGNGTDMSFKLKNTYEISVADPEHWFQYEYILYTDKHK
jgi:hypothetical protein